MSRLHCFLFGVLVGAVGVFSGMKYHIVRADDGLHAIPKVSCQLGGAYVDIREFTAEDWNEHRNLSLAIVDADKSYLLTESASNQFRRSIKSALESLRSDREP